MLSHAGTHLDRKQKETQIYLDVQSQQNFRFFWRRGNRKTGRNKCEQLEVPLPLSQDESV